MALSEESVNIRKRGAGHPIKVYLDEDNTLVQGMALVGQSNDKLITNQHSIGNGNGLDVNIRSLNGSASDSFGRMRTSALYPLLETTSRYDIDKSIWVDPNDPGSPANYKVGGATIAHDSDNSTIKLRTTTAAGDRALLTSLKNFRYQPGKSQLIMQTLSIENPTEKDCTKRWGYFDDNNGLFWEVRDVNGVATLGVVIRTTDGGGTTDNFIPQTSFNRDKLDGTGDLGLQTDLTKSNIYYISFQFLGVGIVEFGVYCRDGRIIPAHVFQNANVNTYSYMQTALLPLRYECVNTATTAGASGINVLCATVNSEGGSSPLHTIVHSADTGAFASIAGSEQYILSLRAKDLINTVRNKVEIVPNGLFVAVDTGAAIIRVRLNSTITSPSWITPPDDPNSAAQYDIAGTGTPDGPIVATYVVNKDQSMELDLARIFGVNTKSITYNNADVQESISITVEKAAANSDVLASLTWKEIR